MTERKRREKKANKTKCKIKHGKMRFYSDINVHSYRIASHHRCEVQRMKTINTFFYIHFAARAYERESSRQIDTYITMEDAPN